MVTTARPAARSRPAPQKRGGHPRRPRARLWARLVSRGGLPYRERVYPLPLIVGRASEAILGRVMQAPGGTALWGPVSVRHASSLGGHTISETSRVCVLVGVRP